MPWGAFRWLPLWYEVEEAENYCHKAQQDKSVHTQEDYPTNIVLQGKEKERGRSVGILAYISKIVFFAWSIN